jgi:galactose-1-phosphate uridylyltransferase
MTSVRLRGKSLTQAVYNALLESWPMHPSDVCRKLGMEVNVSNISKIKYHFDLLEDQNKIRTKKIDRALVGWPSEIERLRMIHDFMRDIN